MGTALVSRSSSKQEAFKGPLRSPILGCRTRRGDRERFSQIRVEEIAYG